MSITQETETKFQEASDAYRAVSATSSSTIGRQFITRGAGRVREEYNRQDYEYYRPGESGAKSCIDTIRRSNDYYYKIGIVRNIIDLMADFVVKGIDWSHPNRNVEAFMQRWFETVNGNHVSERFSNYLLRLGNTCIYTNRARVPDKIAREWRKSKGAEFKNITTKSKTIPSSYVFLDILSLNIISKGVSANSKILISLPIGSGADFSLKNGQYINTSNLAIPPELLKNVNSKGVLELSSEDIKLFHYKKDDWKTLADPIIGSILEPLQVLEKMHLADMSALDGAISNIRLWKVGYIDTTNINNSFIPNKLMLDKVADLIYNNVSGGVLDLIFGPELDFKESSTEVHQFLGPEKYVQVMSEIYDGLGIPPNLAGGSHGGSSTGFTNNFISMKVLVERLNYVRNQLKAFWEGEARQIQKAMGFSSPAKLEFDDAILSDEAQYKKLLIELYDRDVISKESIREEFNLMDNVETSRVKRELNRQEKGRDPQKAGPYANPLWQKQLYVELIKQGKLDPDEIGLDIELEEDVMETTSPKTNQNPTKMPNPGGPGGRPPGSTDQTKRKTKIVRPRTTASDFYKIYSWAKDAYVKISNIVSPYYLKSVAKKSLRDLTSTEFDSLEDFKLSVLCSCDIDSIIDSVTVGVACNNLANIDIERSLYNNIIQERSKQIDTKISIKDKRNAACAAFSLSKMEKK